MTRKTHWEEVYRRVDPTAVSWYQPLPERSLELVARCTERTDAGIIDVGGGTSFLVDALLSRGHTDVTVLDISAAALDAARSRLGTDAARVAWIQADVADWLPPRTWDVWHDRAVFHFLTDPRDRAAYRRALEAALPEGSWLVLATFGPDGPTRCSGLDVQRYDAETLAEAVGSCFEQVEAFTEDHRTPSGAVQQFLWSRFRRTDA